MLSTEFVEALLNLNLHIVRFLRCVHLEVHALSLIVIRDRRRLLVIVREARFECLGIVILSLNQVLARLVVLAFDLGWVEFDVVRSAGRRVNSAAFDTLDEDGVVEGELDD